MIHPLADCQCHNIPEGTRIWHSCVILPEAQIGEECNICSHCLVENQSIIGNRCTIKSAVQIWDGIEQKDEVFVGANVSFTNDKYPHSVCKEWTLFKTKVYKGATIGAGSTVLPRLTICEGAMIAVGSVVTKDVPARDLWVSNPAEMINDNCQMSDNKVNKNREVKVIYLNRRACA